MNSIPLSTLLTRMNRYQVIDVIEEQYKVRDLDEAIRNLEREVKAPWKLKRSTMRIFDNILIYPVASDHDELGYLDNSKRTNYDNKARFKYTSIQQFFEDPDDRNTIAEIWDNGTKFLGVRYKDFIGGSQLIDSANNTTYYGYSGDVTSIETDNVFYFNEANTGENQDGISIKINVTNNTNVAEINCTPTILNDGNYRQKYAFYRFYLGGNVTNIELRFGNDSSNYFSKTVTTQFSGQALSVNNWNSLAFDLNDCTEVGTVNSATFKYFAVILNGAETGTYYIDATYLRRWGLFDYLYYSNYNVKTVSSSVPNQAYFIDQTTESYATDTELVGELEYNDVIMYDAMMSSLMDQKESNEYAVIYAKREKAWERLLDKYPDLVPVIITDRWNFQTDYNNNSINNR